MAQICLQVDPFFGFTRQKAWNLLKLNRWAWYVWRAYLRKILSVFGALEHASSLILTCFEYDLDMFKSWI